MVSLTLLIVHTRYTHTILTPQAIAQVSFQRQLYKLAEIYGEIPEL